MLHRKVLLVVLLFLVAGAFTTLSYSQTQAAALPEKGGCPSEIQMGKVEINISPREMNSQTEIHIIPCSGMNVQVTGGMMLNVPVVVNAVVHQDSLLLTAHLLSPEPGPVVVTVYWRVD